MDVWVTWKKRQRHCEYCSADILVATPVVVMQWRTKQGWKWRRYAHPRCWIHNAFSYLRNNPYTPPIRSNGRPRLVLSDEDKAKRLALLMKGATIRQRIKFFAKRLPEVGAANRIQDWNDKLQRTATELENYGGVPKGWQL